MELGLDTVFFIIGLLLALNTGRGFAKRTHDTRLARKQGFKSSLPLSLPLYIMLILTLLFNIMFFAFTTLLTLSVKTILYGFNLAAALAGTVYSLIVVAAGYTFFLHRYRNVDRPLTREGRIMLASAGVFDKAASAVEEKVAGAPGAVLDTLGAIGGADRVFHREERGDD